MRGLFIEAHFAVFARGAKHPLFEVFDVKIGHPITQANFLLFVSHLYSPMLKSHQSSAKAKDIGIKG